MEYIEQLKKNNLLHSNMEILDVGCHDGKFSYFFTQYGNVDAIDKFDDIVDKTNINFTQINLEEFSTDKKYDLIFARNVFFFSSDPITEASRYSKMLNDNGIFCLTFMGIEDPWTMPNAAGAKCTAVTQEQVTEFVKSFEQVWFFEDTTEHPRMDGKGVKKWHLYKLILKKK